MVFFITAIIDVVHSLMRMIRGLQRKEAVKRDLEELGIDKNEEEEEKKKEQRVDNKRRKKDPATLYHMMYFNYALGGIATVMLYMFRFDVIGSTCSGDLLNYYP